MSGLQPALEVAAAAQACAAREPQWLSNACGLPPETVASLLPFYLPLAEHIAKLRADTGATLTIGIQGPQGAGKTTLTHLLQTVLREVTAFGSPAATARVRMTQLPSRRL